jgi:hypothetical protein
MRSMPTLTPHPTGRRNPPGTMYRCTGCGRTGTPLEIQAHRRHHKNPACIAEPDIILPPPPPRNWAQTVAPNPQPTTTHPEVIAASAPIAPPEPQPSDGHTGWGDPLPPAPPAAPPPASLPEATKLREPVDLPLRVRTYYDDARALLGFEGSFSDLIVQVFDTFFNDVLELDTGLHRLEEAS